MTWKKIAALYASESRHRYFTACPASIEFDVDYGADPGWYNVYWVWKYGSEILCGNVPMDTPEDKIYELAMDSLLGRHRTRTGVDGWNRWMADWIWPVTEWSSKEELALKLAVFCRCADIDAAV